MAKVNLQDDPFYPRLTLPEQEAAAVYTAYGEAGTILEYGSGGSTEMAARMPGKSVFSVESDAKWVAQMRGWFAANPPACDLNLHHANIGPTREWGYPADHKRCASWPGYPVSVWDRADFQHPDVVLIDGRFRAACFLTTLVRITRPVTVLWDDYIDRRAYHFVEGFCQPSVIIGRMAVFEVSPMAFPVEKLGLILSTYMRPQ